MWTGFKEINRRHVYSEASKSRPLEEQGVEPFVKLGEGNSMQGAELVQGHAQHMDT